MKRPRDEAAGHGSAGAPQDAWSVRLHDSPARLDAAAWDALVEASPSATPFMRHAYLVALHDSASAVPDTGWAPQYLAVEHDGALVAACPLYVKSHSYGEYVFDWSWANAYENAGRECCPHSHTGWNGRLWGQYPGAGGCYLYVVFHFWRPLPQ